MTAISYELRRHRAVLARRRATGALEGLPDGGFVTGLPAGLDRAALESMTALERHRAVLRARNLQREPPDDRPRLDVLGELVPGTAAARPPEPARVPEGKIMASGVLVDAMDPRLRKFGRKWYLAGDTELIRLRHGARQAEG